MSGTNVSDTTISPSDLAEQDSDLDDAQRTSGESDEESPESSLSLDVIFDALKNQRRRRVIQYLKSAEEPVELREVSEYIAAVENNKSISQVSYDERKRVYVGLYQCHLPRMDDENIIAFNQSRGEMELTDQAEELFPYLELSTESRNWYQYYGLIVVVGFALLGLSLVENGLMFASPAVVLFAVLVAVSVCAGCQGWFRKK